MVYLCMRVTRTLVQVPPHHHSPRSAPLVDKGVHLIFCSSNPQFSFLCFEKIYISPVRMSQLWRVRFRIRKIFSILKYPGSPFPYLSCLFFLILSTFIYFTYLFYLLPTFCDQNLSILTYHLLVCLQLVYSNLVKSSQILLTSATFGNIKICAQTCILCDNLIEIRAQNSHGIRMVIESTEKSLSVPGEVEVLVQNWRIDIWFYSKLLCKQFRNNHSHHYDAVNHSPHR